MKNKDLLSSLQSVKNKDLKQRVDKLANYRKNWYTRWWGIFILIILGLILALIISFSFYIYSLVQKINSGEISEIMLSQELNQFVTPGKYNMEDPKSAWTGALNSKITIVEFIDFNCPVCKKSHLTLQKIINQYKQDIKVVVRHFPVITENSLELALASECANEQGKFWKMYDLLFTTTNPAENLQFIAIQTGLNINKFNICLQDQKYLNKVKADANAVNNTGTRGTPTWFINGHKIDGAIDDKIFLQIIETLVSQ